MLFDIDKNAKDKIKMWDNEVSKTFPLIFEIISYDFFDRDSIVNVTNYKGNQIKAMDMYNKCCYLSYNPVSDILNEEIIICDEEKYFGYEINKTNHGINLNLKEMRKKFDRDSILDICILGYGIVVRICNSGKIDAYEFRGNNLSIDYYKLMSSGIENVKDVNYIIDCINGEIEEICKNQYGRKNNYYMDREQVTSTYRKALRKE